MCYIDPSIMTIYIWTLIYKLFQLILMVVMGYISYYLGYGPVNQKHWYMDKMFDI